MRHSVLGVPLACALALTACGGNHSEQARNDTSGAPNNPLLNSDTRPQPISTTGCLTSANGRYVVTALDSNASVPTTVTYQLNGGDETNLQKNVNREVRVAGEADAAKIADVRDVGTPAVGTSGATTNSDQQSPQPRVKTQEAMRFEVRNLKVLSVTPTGDECPSAPASQDQNGQTQTGQQQTR